MSECWLEGRRWCFGGHKVWGRLRWVSCGLCRGWLEVRLIRLKALFSSWGGCQGSAVEENWGEVAGVDQSGGEADGMNDGWGVSERAC